MKNEQYFFILNFQILELTSKCILSFEMSSGTRKKKRAKLMCNVDKLS